MIRFVLLLIFIAAPTAAQPPAAIEKELLGYLKTMAESGSYSGNYDEEKLAPASDALKNKLMRYATRADVLNYAFPKLKEEMFITTSRDGRLRIYSWDEETGGTMHDYYSLFQYRGSDGTVRAWVPADSGEEDFVGGFFNQIFQVRTATTPFYLAVSTSIGSTSMHGQNVQAITIEGDRLNLNAKLIRTNKGLSNSVGFGYDFFSVVDRPERPVRLFEYNEAKREFRFPVVIEDEETRQGRVTNRFITYRFNGRHFVKVD